MPAYHVVGFRFLHQTQQLKYKDMELAARKQGRSVVTDPELLFWKGRMNFIAGIIFRLEAEGKVPQCGI